MLSVVIPTLGRAILVQTLESLARTTDAAQLEIIVAGKIPDPGVAAAVARLQAQHPQIQHLPISFTRGDSSEKKNAGWRAARAEVIAFLDDDVIVQPDWPQRILEPFREVRVGLVSGPSLVPNTLPRMARLAGLTLASKAAGYVAARYTADRTDSFEAKWSNLIGCNMAFRKSVLAALGGFDVAFWPGEEMLAAFRATQAGHVLIFVPRAALQHFPRATFTGFLRQMYGYGATRIRLIRSGVEREWTTLVPAAWVASLLLLGLAALVMPWALWLLGLNLALYLCAAIIITLAKLRETGRAGDALIFFLIPCMHLAYGWAEWVEYFRPNADLSVSKKEEPCKR
jgi:cellulose synthase/poly-beta-1,6-N-acetylglucosamine synthase-like glycosyltransferase